MSFPHCMHVEGSTEDKYRQVGKYFLVGLDGFLQVPQYCCMTSVLTQ